MKPTRILALAAAPLALMLGACDSETAGTTGEVPQGEPIAEIPAPDGAAWTDTVTVTDYDGYQLGNPDAPIKLVEYASLTCPACAAFAGEATEPLKQEYISSGRVSYEIRNQIHGPHDLILARLARCGQKESFHPLAEQLWANLQGVLQPVFDNQQAAEQAMSLPPEQRFVAFAENVGFLDWFAARGLSKDQARQCLSDPASMETIANNSQAQSEEFDVTGTPTFFVNGALVDGNGWAQIEPALQRAGAR